MLWIGTVLIVVLATIPAVASCARVACRQLL